MTTKELEAYRTDTAIKAAEAATESATAGRYARWSYRKTEDDATEYAAIRYARAQRAADTAKNAAEDAMNAAIDATTQYRRQLAAEQNDAARTN